MERVARAPTLPSIPSHRFRHGPPAALRGLQLVSVLVVAAPCHAQRQPPSPDGPAPAENSPSQCQNGLDDDGDGLIDCDDDGCGQLIFCLNRDAPTEDDARTCHNHRDDDGDGLIDCRDEGCAAQCRRSMTYGQLEGRSVYAPREAEEPPPRMEYVEHQARGEYPQAWAAHPLTYRRGMLVPEFALSAQPIFARFGVDQLARLGVGLSYGLFDFWQVTVVPVPLRLAPVVDVENPAIETTVRLFSVPEFELGLAMNVGIPIGRSDSNSFPQPVPRGSLLSRARFYDVAHLDMGLLARVHIEDLVRIDLELPVAALIFGSHPYSGELQPRLDLSFIARVGVSIARYVYAGVYSGAFIAGPNYNVGRVPFGFFAGVVIPGWRRGPAADLGVRFGWPVLYDGGASPEVDPGFWQLTFDARVFSWLLP